MVHLGSQVLKIVFLNVFCGFNQCAKDPSRMHSFVFNYQIRLCEHYSKPTHTNELNIEKENIFFQYHLRFLWLSLKIDELETFIIIRITLF